ncbi:hypothetical protein JEQ03_14735 [Serratia marcescens]|uniref:alpha-glutamyl/putrescinyl thymine pyrophosphorylase clade 3 protein n=1 Tax=Serratia ureilytica TaxID=300181 RepID=UPI0018D8EC97|nr:hypothetical protein [Serratia ureilytica]MBH2916816.1 hypothetical protein [Serratia marcescens]MBH3291576.1 hypothetical protein [Serratia marcescens]MBH3320885.1 hypothetical protein [Serratia ureilytica]MBI6198359.1 hypothetical protein [Serratia marcescens]
MRRHEHVSSLVEDLKKFHKDESPLNGLSSEECYITFAMQLTDSIRRIRYVEITSNPDRDINPLRSEPNSDYFDPLLSASLYHRAGNYDEACWLVFLSTHFGKNIKTGWQLCRDIYSGLGTQIWTWNNITDNFEAFERWFKDSSDELMSTSTQRQYGNHRKYETLKNDSKRSIPRVFRSYIDFIGKTKSHAARFAEAEMIARSPESLFELLYSNMRSVISFGRTAKFDYLTMLRKKNLLNIEPSHPFLTGSTGPIKGGRLLFNNNRENGDSINILNEKLSLLAEILPIEYLRMQVLEDALCNWQKSPDDYKYFGG